MFEVMVEQGTQYNIVTFNVLIDALCNENPDIYIYNSLINGYYSVGRLDDARRLFNSMDVKGNKLDVLSNNVLTNGCKHSEMKGFCDEGVRGHNGIPYIKLF